MCSMTSTGKGQRKPTASMKQKIFANCAVSSVARARFTTNATTANGQHRRGITNGTIARQLGRISKSGDLYHLQKRVKNYTHDEKERVVENLEAGDEPEDAVKDAKGFTRE